MCRPTIRNQIRNFSVDEIPDITNLLLQQQRQLLQEQEQRQRLRLQLQQQQQQQQGESDDVSDNGNNIHDESSLSIRRRARIHITSNEEISHILSQLEEVDDEQEQELSSDNITREDNNDVFSQSQQREIRTRSRNNGIMITSLQEMETVVFQAAAGRQSLPQSLSSTENDRARANRERREQNGIYDGLYEPFARNRRRRLDENRRSSLRTGSFMNFMLGLSRRGRRWSY